MWYVQPFDSCIQGKRHLLPCMQETNDCTYRILPSYRCLGLNLRHEGVFELFVSEYQLSLHILHKNEVDEVGRCV